MYLTPIRHPNSRQRIHLKHVFQLPSSRPASGGNLQSLNLKTLELAVPELVDPCDWCHGEMDDKVQDIVAIDPDSILRQS